MPIDHMGQFIREEGEYVQKETPTVSVENEVIVQREEEVLDPEVSKVQEEKRRKVLEMLKAGK